MSFAHLTIWHLIHIFIYTSVRFNYVSISNIENFERFMIFNAIFSYEMISEHFNDVSSINTMAFNLFIDRIYYLLQLFNGHLNGHNSFFKFLVTHMYTQSH